MSLLFIGGSQVNLSALSNLYTRPQTTVLLSQNKKRKTDELSLAIQESYEKYGDKFPTSYVERLQTQGVLTTPADVVQPKTAKFEPVPTSIQDVSPLNRDVQQPSFQSGRIDDIRLSEMNTQRLRTADHLEEVRLKLQETQQLVQTEKDRLRSQAANNNVNINSEAQLRKLSPRYAQLAQEEEDLANDYAITAAQLAELEGRLGTVEKREGFDPTVEAERSFSGIGDSNPMEQDTTLEPVTLPAESPVERAIRTGTTGKIVSPTFGLTDIVKDANASVLDYSSGIDGRLDTNNVIAGIDASMAKLDADNRGEVEAPLPPSPQDEFEQLGADGQVLVQVGRETATGPEAGVVLQDVELETEPEPERGPLDIMDFSAQGRAIMANYQAVKTGEAEAVPQRDSEGRTAGVTYQKVDRPLVKDLVAPTSIPDLAPQAPVPDRFTDEPIDHLMMLAAGYKLTEQGYVPINVNPDQGFITGSGVVGVSGGRDFSKSGIEGALDGKSYIDVTSPVTETGQYTKRVIPNQIDPTSPQGQLIQSIYARQVAERFEDAKQQEYVAALRKGQVSIRDALLNPRTKNQYIKGGIKYENIPQERIDSINKYFGERGISLDEQIGSVRQVVKYEDARIAAGQPLPDIELLNDKLSVATRESYARFPSMFTPEEVQRLQNEGVLKRDRDLRQYVTPATFRYSPDGEPVFASTEPTEAEIAEQQFRDSLINAIQKRNETNLGYDDRANEQLKEQLDSLKNEWNKYSEKPVSNETEFVIAYSSQKPTDVGPPVLEYLVTPFGSLQQEITKISTQGGDVVNFQPLAILGEVSDKQLSEAGFSLFKFPEQLPSVDPFMKSLEEAEKKKVEALIEEAKAGTIESQIASPEQIEEIARNATKPIPVAPTSGGLLIGAGAVAPFISDLTKAGGDLLRDARNTLFKAFAPFTQPEYYAYSTQQPVFKVQGPVGDVNIAIPKLPGATTEQQEVFNRILAGGADPRERSVQSYLTAATAPIANIGRAITALATEKSEPFVPTPVITKSGNIEGQALAFLGRLNKADYVEDIFDRSIESVAEPAIAEAINPDNEFMEGLSSKFISNEDKNALWQDIQKYPDYYAINTASNVATFLSGRWVFPIVYDALKGASTSRVMTNLRLAPVLQSPRVLESLSKLITFAATTDTAGKAGTRTAIRLGIVAKLMQEGVPRATAEQAAENLSKIVTKSKIKQNIEQRVQSALKILEDEQARDPNFLKRTTGITPEDPLQGLIGKGLVIPRAEPTVGPAGFTDIITPSTATPSPIDDYERVLATGRGWAIPSAGPTPEPFRVSVQRELLDLPPITAQPSPRTPTEFIEQFGISPPPEYFLGRRASGALTAVQEQALGIRDPVSRISRQLFEGTTRAFEEVRTTPPARGKALPTTRAIQEEIELVEKQAKDIGIKPTREEDIRRSLESILGNTDVMRKAEADLLKYGKTPKDIDIVDFHESRELVEAKFGRFKIRGGKKYEKNYLLELQTREVPEAIKTKYGVTNPEDYAHYMLITQSPRKSKFAKPEIRIEHQFFIHKMDDIGGRREIRVPTKMFNKDTDPLIKRYPNVDFKIRTEGDDTILSIPSGAKRIEAGIKKSDEIKLYETQQKILNKKIEASEKLLKKMQKQRIRNFTSTQKSKRKRSMEELKKTIKNMKEERKTFDQAIDEASERNKIDYMLGEISDMEDTLFTSSINEKYIGNAVLIRQAENIRPAVGKIEILNELESGKKLKLENIKNILNDKNTDARAVMRELADDGAVNVIGRGDNITWELAKPGKARAKAVKQLTDYENTIQEQRARIKNSEQTPYFEKELPPDDLGKVMGSSIEANTFAEVIQAINSGKKARYLDFFDRHTDSMKSQLGLDDTELFKLHAGRSEALKSNMPYDTDRKMLTYYRLQKITEKEANGILPRGTATKFRELHERYSGIKKRNENYNKMLDEFEFISKREGSSEFEVERAQKLAKKLQDDFDSSRFTKQDAEKLSKDTESFIVTIDNNRIRGILQTASELYPATNQANARKIINSLTKKIDSNRDEISKVEDTLTDLSLADRLKRIDAGTELKEGIGFQPLKESDGKLRKLNNNLNELFERSDETNKKLTELDKQEELAKQKLGEISVLSDDLKLEGQIVYDELADLMGLNTPEKLARSLRYKPDPKTGTKKLLVNYWKWKKSDKGNFYKEDHWIPFEDIFATEGMKRDFLKLYGAKERSGLGLFRQLPEDVARKRTAESELDEFGPIDQGQSFREDVLPPDAGEAFLDLTQRQKNLIDDIGAKSKAYGSLKKRLQEVGTEEVKLRESLTELPTQRKSLQDQLNELNANINKLADDTITERKRNLKLRGLSAQDVKGVEFFGTPVLPRGILKPNTKKALDLRSVSSNLSLQMHQDLEKAAIVRKQYLSAKSGYDIARKPLENKLAQMIKLDNMEQSLTNKMEHLISKATIGRTVTPDKPVQQRIAGEIAGLITGRYDEMSDFESAYRKISPDAQRALRALSEKQQQAISGKGVLEPEQLDELFVTTWRDRYNVLGNSVSANPGLGKLVRLEHEIPLTTGEYVDLTHSGRKALADYDYPNDWFLQERRKWYGKTNESVIKSHIPDEGAVTADNIDQVIVSYAKKVQQRKKAVPLPSGFIGEAIPKYQTARETLQEAIRANAGFMPEEEVTRLTVKRGRYEQPIEFSDIRQGLAKRYEKQIDYVTEQLAELPSNNLKEADVLLNKNSKVILDASILEGKKAKLETENINLQKQLAEQHDVLASAEGRLDLDVLGKTKNVEADIRTKYRDKDESFIQSKIEQELQRINAKTKYATYDYTLLKTTGDPSKPDTTFSITNVFRRITPDDPTYKTDVTLKQYKQSKSKLKTLKDELKTKLTKEKDDGSVIQVDEPNWDRYFTREEQGKLRLLQQQVKEQQGFVDSYEKLTTREKIKRGLSETFAPIKPKVNIKGRIRTYDNAIALHDKFEDVLIQEKLGSKQQAEQFLKILGDNKDKIGFAKKFRTNVHASKIRKSLTKAKNYDEQVDKLAKLRNEIIAPSLKKSKTVKFDQGEYNKFTDFLIEERRKLKTRKQLGLIDENDTKYFNALDQLSAAKPTVDIIPPPINKIKKLNKKIQKLTDKADHEKSKLTEHMTDIHLDVKKAVKDNDPNTFITTAKEGRIEEDFQSLTDKIRNLMPKHQKGKLTKKQFDSLSEEAKKKYRSDKPEFDLRGILDDLNKDAKKSNKKYRYDYQDVKDVIDRWTPKDRSTAADMVVLEKPPKDFGLPKKKLTKKEKQLAERERKRLAKERKENWDAIKKEGEKRRKKKFVATGAGTTLGAGIGSRVLTDIWSIPEATGYIPKPGTPPQGPQFEPVTTPQLVPEVIPKPAPGVQFKPDVGAGLKVDALPKTGTGIKQIPLTEAKTRIKQAEITLPRVDTTQVPRFGQIPRQRYVQVELEATKITPLLAPVYARPPPRPARPVRRFPPIIVPPVFYYPPGQKKPRKKDRKKSKKKKKLIWQVPNTPFGQYSPQEYAVQGTKLFKEYAKVQPIDI